MLKLESQPRPRIRNPSGSGAIRNLSRGYGRSPNVSASSECEYAEQPIMEAYRESVDWMYSDPKALEMYSKKMNQPVDLLKESMDKFQPKETMQTDKFADLDGAIRDAVQLKFLDKPLTQDQIAELLQIPPRKK